MRIATIVAVLLAAIQTNFCQAQADGTTANHLSPAAMQALVAGVAFYPDATIEQILDAAQYPEAISQAAQPNVRQANPNWPPSVQQIFTQQGVVKQLDTNPTITARLSLAARTQLADLWTAIDQVRADFAALTAANAEQEQEGEYTEEAAPSDGGSGAVAYPTGAFVAGFWTAQAAQEIHNWYDDNVTVQSTTTTATVTGPAGESATISGSSTTGAATVGDTTYFGGSGEGTISTSTGAEVYGQGQLSGSATQTADGATFQTQASGSVESASGFSGQGTHSGSGGYSVNSDGSVDFGHSGQTSTSSTAGASDISHSGSGTYTGDGTGVYQGSSSVDSTYGSLSTNTTAGNGQATTTVTTDQGQQTFTAGDGQIGDGSTSSGSASSGASQGSAAKSSAAQSSAAQNFAGQNPSAQSQFGPRGGWNLPAESLSQFPTGQSLSSRLKNGASQFGSGQLGAAVQNAQSRFGRAAASGFGANLNRNATSGFARPGSGGALGGGLLNGNAVGGANPLGAGTLNNKPGARARAGASPSRARSGGAPNRSHGGRRGRR